MAEVVMWELASKALESLAKSALQDAATWWGARDELKKLENSIRMIKARVSDAEKNQEAEGSHAIKEWLRRLRLVLYQADDLFDEVLTTERQKQQMERGALAKAGSLFSRSATLFYNRKLAREMKSIRKELEAIKSDMAGLNLNVYDHKEGSSESQQPMTHLMKKRETAAFVKADDIIGRENDKDVIIEMLFDPNYDGESVTVIPIVGFGGLGKTTLAQLVFNDESVWKQFDLTKWVCVPEVNNQKAVMGKLYRCFTDEEDSGNRSLNQIISQIQDSIRNRKYLLVLDDIWDDSRDRWLDLMSLLECGHIGSKVIVTTRSDVVAKVVGTIPKPYRLGCLTDEESWDLFKRLAFRRNQEGSNPTLTQIGKEIVGSCGNVPLAIRVVGSLLYSKDSEKEWQHFKGDQLKAKLMEEGNIMPVLKLSYDYLSPALKQCFSYCSLFPKGYEFSKADLAHLWMAQGYFEPSNRDIGDQYFLELLGRNFFQDPKEDGKGNIKTCKMHDLVHDLAQHT